MTMQPITLDGWISVNDYLPEDGQRVIILYVGLVFMVDYKIYEEVDEEDKRTGFYDDDSSKLSPDYWLPFTVKMPEK